MSTDDKENIWVLVYAKVNQEKRAKENLENQGFETFLPMATKKNKHQSKSISLKAIFPRYLFTKINFKSDNWNLINSTKGVSQLVIFGNNYAVVPDQTIELIKSKLDASDIFHPKTMRHKFLEGDKLTIKKGMLAGINAIFLAEKSKERVKLLLKFLKTPMIAEISKLDLEEKESVEAFKLQP